MAGDFDEMRRLVGKSIFEDKLVLYQKLATNSQDFSGNDHNGMDTSMSYSGGYGQFNPGYITVPRTNDDFLFTDGTNDIPFAVAFSFIWDDKSPNQIFFSKDTNVGFRISVFSNEFYFVMWKNSSNRIDARFPTSSFVNGTEYHMLFQYDASKSQTGASIYRNNNYAVSSQSQIGTYTGMTSETENLMIGARNGGTGILRAKMRNAAIWKGRNFDSSERTELYNRQVNNISFI